MGKNFYIRKITYIGKKYIEKMNCREIINWENWSPNHNFVLFVVFKLFFCLESIKLMFCELSLLIVSFRHFKKAPIAQF